VLREPLSPDQGYLIRMIFEPFEQAGEWPFWQYVDLSLDSRFGIGTAADVLASLPGVGERAPASLSYGLTWRQDSHSQPRPDVPIALTVAGLRYLPEADPLLRSFVAMVQYFVDRQRNLIPSPRQVVEATVSSADIADKVLTASIGGGAAPPVEATMRKLRQLLEHEPFLHYSHRPPRPGPPRRALQPRPVRRRQPREVPATAVARPLRRRACSRPRAGLSPGAQPSRRPRQARSRDRYLSESVNLAHVSAATLSVQP
jgi:hypothetical protein